MQKLFPDQNQQSGVQDKTSSEEGKTKRLDSWYPVSCFPPPSQNKKEVNFSERQEAIQGSLAGQELKVLTMCLDILEDTFVYSDVVMVFCVRYIHS